MTRLALFLFSSLALAQNKPNPVDRLGTMSPAERQKAIESLPPDRRRQAQLRFERLQSLSPSQREALARRYEAFERMSPRKQEQTRALFQRFNQLPPTRHNPVQQGFEQLHDMSSAERQAWLKSKPTRSRYNRKEQAILEDYIALLEAPPR